MLLLQNRKKIINFTFIVKSLEKNTFVIFRVNKRALHFLLFSWKLQEGTHNRPVELLQSRSQMIEIQFWHFIVVTNWIFYAKWLPIIVDKGHQFYLNKKNWFGLRILTKSTLYIYLLQINNTILFNVVINISGVEETQVLFFKLGILLLLLELSYGVGVKIPLALVT